MSETSATSPTTRQRNGVQEGKLNRVRAASPPVDVFENGEEVLVIADIPGVPATAIDVRVENGTLTIEAKRVTENVGPALAREYDEVDLARTFRIPAGIDTTEIKAEAKNGTLLVRLPKIAAAKPRTIAVQAT